MAFSIPLGDLVIRFRADGSQFTRFITSTTARMQRASEKMAAAGRKMMLSITGPLLAIGALSVREFAKFDEAMTQSLSIMSNVTVEMKGRMEDLARTMSLSTKTSAESLAQSYFFLASAGLSAEQSMAALSVVEQFAVAGAFDMARATDLLTDAQSALGLVSGETIQNMENMTRLSDVLLKANTLANASAEQFSIALVTKSAASLRLLNKDVEEGVAVLAAFADQGIKAELAGNALSIVLRDLQKSSIGSREEWDRLGISVFDTAGKMLPIADIVEGLEDAFSSMSDEQKKTTAIMLGFQDRSFSALQTLFGTSDKIREYERQLRAAGGTTQRVAESQLTSFSSQMAILTNNVKDAGIEIGKTLAPMLKLMAGEIQQGLKWWRSMDEEQREFIILAGVATAAIGPLIIVVALLTKALIALATAEVASTAGLVLLAAGAVLATDSILQMTGTANLGMLDMVNSFRIGGMSIGTMMEVAMLRALVAWDSLEHAMRLGWENIKFGARAAFSVVERGFLALLQRSAEIKADVLGLAAIAAEAAVGGFTGKAIGDAIRGRAASEDAQASAFKAGQEASRVADRMRLATHLDTILQMEVDHNKDRLDAARSILAAINEDQRKQQILSKELMADLIIPSAVLVPAAVAETLTIPETSLEKEVFKRELKRSKGSPALGLEEEDASFFGGAPQGFESISLRRFALEGPGGLAQGVTPTQEVEVPGVEEKLQILIDITRDGAKPAWLG